MRTKNHIIIGLTTISPEFLRISVNAIAKLSAPIYIVLHNDNPDIRINKNQIRKFGYRGKLKIINTVVAKGVLNSRNTILSQISNMKIKSDWMIFINDSDIIANLEIPDVSKDNFAIMQNKIIIKNNLSDLFKAMDNPKKFISNNFNCSNPNTGINGSLIKTDIMLNADRNISDTGADIDYLMWQNLQSFARNQNPDSVPIYMNETNYIRNIFE